MVASMFKGVFVSSQAKIDTVQRSDCRRFRI